MSNIKILPEILSNKIAAGEVVERPAAVVKELVENAIDAGSNRIIIEIEKGGRALIQVADNGIGMNYDDALLCIERYATSKISSDQDLFSIRTLGFRGEALPSIAAVSRFSLITRAKNAQAGTEIIIEGGKIKKISEVGAPIGTMVTVKHLFFNTPARRKFLKTISTEMSHIADTIAGMAMGWPAIQFMLHHNGKIIKNWPVASDSVERIADVLGTDLRKNLKKIEFDKSGISVTGWISSPRIIRSTSRGIYIYINGRAVRSKIIQHALFEGYSGRLIKNQFPVAVLFIKLPFDQVDVNVHPTKSEVRFLESQKVHDTISAGVSETLQAADQYQWPQNKSQNKTKLIISESLPDFSSRPNFNLSEKESPRNPKKITYDVPKFEPSKQRALWNKRHFDDLRIIGQLHHTYIVCESNEGLILIDQHAAHERILFEQLKHQSTSMEVRVQKLLIPETIDLGYREAQLLERLIPDLLSMGLEIEPFGGHTFAVKSIPALLSGRDVKSLVVEIIEKIAGLGVTKDLKKTIDPCLMLMACHGAIRAGQNLTIEEIKALIRQLDQCDNPSHCPHGRPTWISWPLKSLEKSFNRIV
ncbi:MAG: DNA mismatch repair endonuclease MutL [Desulfobacterales bacterium]|nr:DNA mismatch repair endonuclease MutL [Desulfobacterales bacterium]